jgi:hypothetical protein
MRMQRPDLCATSQRPGQLSDVIVYHRDVIIGT